MTSGWNKKIVEWTEGRDAFLSVVFTWHLPKAFSRCVWYRQEGYTVYAGGPAVFLMPQVLAGVASIGDIGDYNSVLQRHNPEATRTSRGCIRQCPYCAVWRIEGDLTELSMWDSKPIVCDNNLLACSLKHFDRVIDTLKPVPGVDMNQGLDARLLNDHHVDRLQELDLDMIRFAWDSTRDEPAVINAINRITRAGFPKRKIRVYVLFGLDDTPGDALYRFETLKALGIKANPMRYQPLDTMERNRYISPKWTGRELLRMMKYWARQNWYSKIPYAEFMVR